MKKKVLFIICGAVIASIIIAMIVFVLSGNNDMTIEPISVEGTWKVVAYVNNGTISIVDNEYMVFDAENVSDYRNNTTEPFATSKFSIDSKMLMSLPDISRNYTVEKYTENYIRLYESQNVYMELIRYSNADMSPIDVDTSTFEGKWNIIYRNTSNVYAGDYMIFENGTASQYSIGSNDPVATSSYSWQNENHLVVDGWSKEMVLYPISNDAIIMVELATDIGFIWEFQRAN